jgi:hypothetical protein
MNESERAPSEELLDEESLAVLAILLAVSLEFGFGFAKIVDWWAGFVAAPAALSALVALLRVQRTHRLLLRIARWVVRPNEDHGVAQPSGNFEGDLPRSSQPDPRL